MLTLEYEGCRRWHRLEFPCLAARLKLALTFPLIYYQCYNKCVHLGEQEFPAVMGRGKPSLPWFTSSRSTSAFLFTMINHRIQVFLKLGHFWLDSFCHLRLFLKKYFNVQAEISPLKPRWTFWALALGQWIWTVTLVILHWFEFVESMGLFYLITFGRSFEPNYGWSLMDERTRV